MLDSDNGSFLGEAGPLPVGAAGLDLFTMPADAHAVTAQDVRDTLARAAAHHGAEHLYVGRECDLLAQAPSERVVLSHLMAPHVRLPLGSDPVDVAQAVAQLFCSMEQVRADIDAAEAHVQRDAERGLRRASAGNDALSRLLLSDDIAALAENRASMVSMLRGASREEVLARVARVQAALAALPPELWSSAPRTDALTPEP